MTWSFCECNGCKAVAEQDEKRNAYRYASLAKKLGSERSLERRGYRPNSGRAKRLVRHMPGFSSKKRRTQ
jgi:hypothetical protein